MTTLPLAQTLRVSRTMTSSAYDELFAEGYLESRRGSGTHIGRHLPPTSLSPSIFHTKHTSTLTETSTSRLTK